ncbi:uncharacterized protein LOC141792988 isoform X2 [Halichoeres trimaculatus]|uniref:uncharacterized protein LOC141792988 isoform X2 n=1 Tax=Halichoeres trimaculatus TaxID=147232 RepID=UPI003D9F2893
MAAQKENLLSFGNLTSAETNTLRQHVPTRRPVLVQAGFSTPQSHQTLRAMKLQERWQELKERELTAKKHNRQLLEQFEEAQERLREMLTLNATMKTIRKEYERYLEENAPRWEQQLKEQTQAAHRRRMGECLRSCRKHTDGISKSSLDHPLCSQGLTEKTQNITASKIHNSQNHFSDYNQDDSLHLPFVPSSWLGHPQSQTFRLPIRAPYQPQPSSHAPQSVPPPPFLLQPTPFPLPNLASTLPPDWGSLLPHHLWAPTASVAGQPVDSGALRGPLHMEEHPTERVEANIMRGGAGTSRSSSSQRGGSGGSRRSQLSQELDTKPVRLSSGHAESSESSRESVQATQERRRKKRRDKRERSQSSSSGREAPDSQGSSRTSSAIIVAPATEVQSSESDSSSKRSSRRRSSKSEALAVVSPRLEIRTKKGIKSWVNNICSKKGESQSAGEEVESPNEESSENSGNPESGSERGDESGSVSVKIEDDRDESGDSGQKSVVEKEEDESEKGLRDGDGENDVGEENSEINKEHEEKDEEDTEASERKNTNRDEDESGAEDDNETGAEDEDGTGAEDEMEEQESGKGEKISKEGKIKMRKQDTEEVDEYGSEGGEDETEADGESDEEESEEEKEQRKDEAGEPEQEGDSDDSIIAPQDKRAKKIYAIPEATEDEEEEEEEEEEGSKSGSSDDDSNGFSDEDIENLLAPQDNIQKKEEKEQSAVPETSDTVGIFQVEQYRSTKENLSDSDEFDHFYD